jgi:hypothetical protein
MAGNPDLESLHLEDIEPEISRGCPTITADIIA